MAIDNQKFPFLAPNAADFRKKMRTFAFSFGLLVLLFIGSLIFELADSPVVSAFKATIPALFGGLIGLAFVNWQSFKNRQLQAKSGHIEIAGETLRIVTGQGEPFSVEFRVIEKLEERNGYLIISYRDRGSLRNRPVLLADIERADEFVLTLNERIATAK